MKRTFKSLVKRIFVHFSILLTGSGEKIFYSQQGGSINIEMQGRNLLSPAECRKVLPQKSFVKVNLSFTFENLELDGKFNLSPSGNLLHL